MAATARASIVTLGCGRNEVDSQQLAGLLLRDDIEVVDDPDAHDDLDVLLVNTCAFIAPAKQESIDTVLAACGRKQEGRARAVIVVGCLAQRYPQELAEAIPEADAIVGFDGYPSLPGLVTEVLAGPLADRVVGVAPPHPGSRPLRAELPVVEFAPPAAAPDTLLGLTVRERAPGESRQAPQDALDRVPASGPSFPVRVHDGGPWAYLKIASGCDRVCTFCAIPSFRGRFRSRPLEELLAEARWLAASGARELVLVSENTTSWGKDLPGGRALQPALLRELGAIDGIERLRLMYLQPAELTRELLEAMAAEPHVAPYFDLSLQHVSAPVLQRMGRSGDHERFGTLIDTIRRLAPEAVLRSNFILGFPGETARDVEVLEEFLVTHRLDWVGLFAFSREDGTPSVSLPDQVPEAITSERLERLASLTERLADDSARAFVGRDLDVLVEQAGPELTVGRSYREAPDTDGEVQLIGEDGRPARVPLGRIVTARVRDAIGVDLVAEVDDLASEAHGG